MFLAESVSQEVSRRLAHARCCGVTRRDVVACSNMYTVYIRYGVNHKYVQYAIRTMQTLP